MQTTAISQSTSATAAGIGADTAATLIATAAATITTSPIAKQSMAAVVIAAFRAVSGPQISRRGLRNFSATIIRRSTSAVALCEGVSAGQRGEHSKNLRKSGNHGLLPLKICLFRTDPAYKAGVPILVTNARRARLRVRWFIVEVQAVQLRFAVDLAVARDRRNDDFLRSQYALPKGSFASAPCIVSDRQLRIIGQGMPANCIATIVPAKTITRINPDNAAGNDSFYHAILAKITEFAAQAS